MDKNIGNISLLVIDGGDGSANISAYTSPELAAMVEELETELGYGGYGEPTRISLKEVLEYRLETPESIFFEDWTEETMDWGRVKPIYNKFLKDKDNIVTDWSRDEKNYVRFKLNGVLIKKFDFRKEWDKEAIQASIADAIKYCIDNE